MIRASDLSMNRKSYIISQCEGHVIRFGSAKSIRWYGADRHILVKTGQCILKFLNIGGFQMDTGYKDNEMVFEAIQAEVILT